MLSETKYLNKSGSRFVTYINGKKATHVFKTLSGKRVQRTLIEQRSFGNFGMAIIWWKGKRIETLLDSILID